MIEEPLALLVVILIVLPAAFFITPVKRVEPDDSESQRRDEE